MSKYDELIEKERGKMAADKAEKEAAIQKYDEELAMHESRIQELENRKALEDVSGEGDGV